MSQEPSDTNPFFLKVEVEQDFLILGLQNGQKTISRLGKAKLKVILKISDPD